MEQNLIVSINLKRFPPFSFLTPRSVIWVKKEFVVLLVVYHLHKISGSFPISFWEISKWYECIPFVSYRNVPNSCPGSQRFPHFLKHCSPLATRPAFAENCCAIFSNTSFFVCGLSDSEQMRFVVEPC